MRRRQGTIQLLSRECRNSIGVRLAWLIDRALVEDQHTLLVAVAFRGTMGDRRPIQKLLKGRRVSYDAAFKLRIVREALCLPPGNRIKPSIEPVQLRKWIRNIEALEEASPEGVAEQLRRRRFRTCAAPLAAALALLSRHERRA